jgi:hypothetical protein
MLQKIDGSTRAAWLLFGSMASPLRAIMVDETSGAEKFEAEYHESDLEDRERMTERALAAIRQTGPAAALEKCCALVDQINAELLKREKIEPFAVAELQAYLTRANAVIKNCAASKNTPALRGKCSVSSDPSPLRLVVDAFLRRVPAFLRKD